MSSNEIAVSNGPAKDDLLRAVANPDKHLHVIFHTLSEAIDVYMTGLHLTPPQGVKVAVCPMVNKPWMQEGPTLANPYYGKEMSTCGSFR